MWQHQRAWKKITHTQTVVSIDFKKWSTIYNIGSKMLIHGKKTPHPQPVVNAETPFRLPLFVGVDLISALVFENKVHLVWHQLSFSGKPLMGELVLKKCEHRWNRVSFWWLDMTLSSPMCSFTRGCNGNIDIVSTLINSELNKIAYWLAVNKLSLSVQKWYFTTVNGS